MNTVLKEFFLGCKGEAHSIRANLINLRWGFVLFAFPAMYFVSENKLPFAKFLVIVMVAFIYNSLATLYIQNGKEKRRKLSNLIFYLDIALIFVTVYVLGGVKSDIYFVLFFVLCYFGVFTDFKNLLFLSFFTVISYSVLCICYDIANSINIDFRFLLQRNLIFVFSIFGIFLIVRELKKYDELHKKEFMLARTDKLTGLLNRHNLEQRLNEEMLHSRITGKPINILIFDIDNFKRFNDSYGHLWGDKLLTLFSDIIRQGIRKNDLAIRYGGEEFLIIIRDLELAIAEKVADRIRAELEKQKIYVGKDEDRKRVTVSCGIAQYPKHSLDMKEVIDLADKALYFAKDTGKNKVVCYEDVLAKEHIG